MNKIFDYLLYNKHRSIFQLCLLALILAYLIEIIFQIAPCTLCIYQRIIYFALLILSFLAYKFNYENFSSKLTIISALFMESMLALYHVAIERHWIEQSEICSSGDNLDNMLTTLKIASDCSTVYFKFMNFSLTEWNFIYSLFMMLIFFKKPQTIKLMQ